MGGSPEACKRVTFGTVWRKRSSRTAQSEPCGCASADLSPLSSVAKQVTVFVNMSYPPICGL